MHIFNTFIAILLYTFSTLAYASSVEHSLLKRFPASKLFSTNHLYHAELPLPADSVSYRDSKEDDEGYYSEKLLTVSGELTTFVHDFSKQHTSEYLYKEFLESLTDSNFEVLYKCEAEDCGDITGWKLFLSEHVFGSELSQKYILSRRQDSDGKHWLVQFYAIDLDGEPRTVLRFIEVDSVPELDIVFSNDIEGAPNFSAFKALPQEIAPIYFEFDKADLTEQSRFTIGSMADEILKSRATKILITGYADKNGPSWYNKLLATRRAETLRDALRQYPELSALDISTYGYGEVDKENVVSPDSMQRRANVFFR
ncbi:DUF4892 domain-containing protein [Microbulbifer bruguierae]|uniref:DUF4892 domain-containing protein n=1 Tax=Microbulbifer bruguierae TaxID=3029061 RepID=A0ABY8N9T9_9GAMM|nr:OmpA family protein [Microbulbifer bruguierae]WGL15415.1 DUF4892 domain-containing protein [Microbulbifer bruguierae]